MHEVGGYVFNYDILGVTLEHAKYKDYYLNIDNIPLNRQLYGVMKLNPESFINT